MFGLALLGVLALVAGAAQARPVDHIAIIVPGNVTPRVVYNVTIRGFARRRAVAYLFVDYLGCARTFSAEHNRAPHESEYYVVRGTFAEVSGWSSSNSGMDHACAYLVATRSGHVLARARVSFEIR